MVYRYIKIMAQTATSPTVVDDCVRPVANAKFISIHNYPKYVVSVIVYEAECQSPLTQLYF